MGFKINGFHSLGLLNKFAGLIFCLLFSASVFGQKKTDSVKVKPKTQAEIAASLVVVFQGQDQINMLLMALDKSNAPHDGVVRPLVDFIYKQIDKQLPDSMKLSKANGFPK